MPKVVEKRDPGQDEEFGPELDELVRDGARRMLLAALDVEVANYIERYRDFRDERGHALVLRNGRARLRKVTVGAGTLEVAAPRVDDRRVSRAGFCRRTCDGGRRWRRRYRCCTCGAYRQETSSRR